MNLDLTVDNEFDPEADGLGILFTAAMAGFSVLGGILGGRNKQKMAGYGAKLNNTATILNKKYSLQENNIARADESIEQLKLKIAKINTQSDALVSETAALLEQQKTAVDKNVAKSNITKTVIGVGALVAISVVAYKKLA